MKSISVREDWLVDWLAAKAHAFSMEDAIGLWVLEADLRDGCLDLDSSEVRRILLRIVRSMLSPSAPGSPSLVPGDVERDGFVAWNCSRDEAIREIERRLEKIVVPLEPGDVVAFAIAP
jgi:hypothetical protein